MPPFFFLSNGDLLLSFVMYNKQNRNGDISMPITNNALPTPVSICAHLLEGYAVDRLADDIRFPCRETCVLMAYQVLDALRAKKPTPENQKNCHAALNLILEDMTDEELSDDWVIPLETAQSYMKVIRSEYNID